jgi:hypothetical protein
MRLITPVPQGKALVSKDEIRRVMTVLQDTGHLNDRVEIRVNVGDLGSICYCLYEELNRMSSILAATGQSETIKNVEVMVGAFFGELKRRADLAETAKLIEGETKQ